MDFAEDHPGSNVMGTDLSLIQPSNFPSNCTFVREDAEEVWVFDKLFDYIHLRMMFSAFVDPKGMIRKIYDNLKPGGWVEYQDQVIESVPADDSMRERLAKTAGVEAQRLWAKGFAAIPGFSREVLSPKHYKEWLIEAGFVDVVEHVVLCPASPWHTETKQKHLGFVAAQLLNKAMENSPKILAYAGLNEDQSAALVRRCREELEDPGYRVYFPM